MSQKHLQPSKPYTRKKIENFSYGLTDTIGKGYSSQVYKGRNDSTQEPVAVKVIDLKMLKCEINRILLNSQIEILKSMRNIPHILTLHEVYTTKNNTYIITELCESDLSKRIKKGLPEQDAYRFMDQFLEGYSHIHNKKLIHRDLKPANLLITHQDQLKIADFGFGIKAEQVLKPSKYNVGSPLYMAPQSLRRNQYSFKTDIWAIGVIFFEMLTGDTPWRAKNQKQLLKKIQNQKIQSIIQKHKFTSRVKEFIVHALTYDKSSRLGPEQMSKFNFFSKPINVLGEKQTNTIVRIDKFESIINKVSPKSYSAQKKMFSNFDRSQKKTQNSTQNISMKNIENIDKKNVTSPNNPAQNQNSSINKQDRKFVSKLLIAEVHFCRFLYKLLGRIKQSQHKGILGEEQEAFNYVDSIFGNFTGIIKQKIAKLKEFQTKNFLDVKKYEEYKGTSDYKKLMKISQDYLDRYSVELKDYWNVENYANFNNSIGSVAEMMEYLTNKLLDRVQEEDPEKSVKHYSKDIIILDYLITCKQLLAMIIKDGQNYQKFAKKSRIEEIVEGATSQINPFLYKKIIDRAKIMLEAPRCHV